MIERFLNTKSRDIALYSALFKYLEGFENEDKCEIVTDLANKLMAKGSEADYFSAEIVLIHATQHYMNVCDTNYKALVYYALGTLYEHYLNHYVKAYTYYEKYALNNTINDGTHSVLLRALILRDNFKYSDQLEKELRHSLGEYDLGYRNDRLYEALGSFIVARHEGDAEHEEELKKKLKTIVKGDEFFFLDFILTKEKTPVRLKVPQKVIDYIKWL